MQLHESTFFSSQPSASQAEDMESMRRSFDELSEKIEAVVPGGPDQTYILRKLRECAMWTNVAITRHADGTPRT